MPVIVVSSEAQGAGKTGVAAAIARHVAYQGRPVRLVRMAGDENSRSDAAYFSSLEFVPGSPAEPVRAESVVNPRVGTYVVESGVADARELRATEAVFVCKRGAPRALPAGLVLTAAVVTALDPDGPVPPDAIGFTPILAIPDDRRLSGFSVSEVQQLLGAELLVAGDDAETTCEQIVIAPISADAGQPYLSRFSNKAVVCRFDRTDMHLAAIRSEPSCLILTGGHRPSDYLFDAARSQGVPVLLVATDTENTMMALESVFESTRFQGDLKLERMSELLAATRLFEMFGTEKRPPASN